MLLKDNMPFEDLLYLRKLCSGYHWLEFIYTGSGVFATRLWPKGSFLMEYKGDLVSYNEGLLLEKHYDEERAGSFLYFFKHKHKQFW